MENYVKDQEKLDEIEEKLEELVKNEEEIKQNDEEIKLIYQNESTNCDLPDFRNCKK